MNASYRSVRGLLGGSLVGFLLTACSPAPAPPAQDTEAGQAGATSPTGGVNAPEWRGTDPVVLISFDGFRWDYLERYRPPAFQEVAGRGVRADAMVPPFPSKTFPSHYTLATGLWPEHHGIVGNDFLDPARNERYGLGDRETVGDGSWYGGEPIWVTAERQGMVAASFFFVGTEADIGGIRPSHWRPFDNSVPAEARVDQALEWLALPPEERPGIVTLYFSDVDNAGHEFGPESPEVAEAVVRVDGYLRRLLDGIDALPHGQDVSLILVSDHGMAYEDPDQVHGVSLGDSLGVRWGAMGTYANLYVPGDTSAHRRVRDRVAAQLPPEVGVHLRSEVPERLHYRESPRGGEVIVVPPVGWTIFPEDRIRPGGRYNHGWDPAAEEMHGIFVAAGPRLSRGVRVDPVRHVDVYPLMAAMLGLDPAPVDGDLSVWTDVLLPSPAPAGG